MRKLIFLGCFCICSNLLVAQQKMLGEVVTRPYNHKLYTDIDGSPFLFDEWYKGSIFMVSGEKIENITIKYDAFEDEILFMQDGKTFDIPSGVKYFILTPGVEGMKDSMIFRGGYPAVENNSGSTFYEVLADGNTSLLKCYRKIMGLSKQNAFVSNKREFALEEKYYVGKPDTPPVRIKKDKASVLKALSDKKDILESYIEKEKKNCKTEAGLIEVVKKYNES